jgi:hypothetical protein
LSIFNIQTVPDRSSPNHLSGFLRKLPQIYE